MNGEPELVRAAPQIFAWPKPLDRVFRAVVFDWDGTAVPDRQSPADEFTRALEKTLRDGVLAVIVTGTRFEHLDRQSLHALSPEAKKNLYVSTNRGSEVYGFDPDGKPVLRYDRKATPEENRALDQASERFQDQLRLAHGLKTEIVRNRLNRRKIDLIPFPQWADPPKADFAKLLHAVEARLESARVPGRLGELVERAIEVARDAGIERPRVTSDVKHIEIGLTDKSDAAYWVKSTLLEEYLIPLEDVVFAGDEFGPVGGLPGSDSLMRSILKKPTDPYPVFFSVGAEPNGTGAGVLDLKGGPERFIAFLVRQAELRARSGRAVPPLWKRHTATPDSAWCVEQEGFDASREREMEAIFSIGNGYLGVRGSLNTPIPSSQSDLFIAGIYDSKVSHLPYSELEFLTPGRGRNPYAERVPIPSPFTIHVSLNGRPLTLIESKWTRHTRLLDLKKGLLFKHYVFVDAEGRKTQVEAFRCASLDDPHLLLHGFDILTERDGEIEISVPLGETELTPSYPHLVLLHEEPEESDFDLRHYRTHDSGYEIAIGARCSTDGTSLRGPTWRTPIAAERPLRVRRFLSVFTSRDGSPPRAAAERHLNALDWQDFDRVLSSHEQRWREFWSRADILFDPSPASTETQRFNSYHLRIGAPRSPQVSVSARTLSGRGYEGHVFWDAEIFLLPFYLNTVPDAARNILLYRHHTLPGARKRAAEMGCAGACFAWESTVTGEDVTPGRILLRSSGKEIPIFTGTQQIHVTADIAYGVWKYWRWTQDEDFLIHHGVELLVETARFWCSRTTSRGDGLHLLNVVGPDEYHHGVNDNAYTNAMAKFNLETAGEALAWLRARDAERFSELESRLRLRRDESEEWARQARALFQPGPDRDGVIEQFEGFFDLERFVVPRQETLRAPIDRLFDWQKVNRLQLIKQADVLMIPFLFRDRFTPEAIRANFNYYEPVTDHGSSLSPSVHATLAAWIGDRDALARYYPESADLDLFNLMKNSALGMHAANMGGAWQALVRGVLGVRFDEAGVRIDPGCESRLLEDWQSIRMSLHYRGIRHPVEVKRKKGDAS